MRWRFPTWTSDPVTKPSSAPLAVTAHVTASIVPAVLDVIGQRWSLAIIQALLLEDKSFGQLLRELHIPRSTLAARLKHLQAMRCLEPSPAGYSLAEAGRALLPIISLARAWDVSVVPETQGYELIHCCGERLLPLLVCRHCAQPIHVRDIQLGAPAELPRLGDLPKPLRRSRAEFSAGEPLSATEILGDRWTAMVVALAFYGVQRYGDLKRHLSIAPNILADRLLRLCEGGVLLREGHCYRLSERGLQLFPLIVALMAWGDRWLRETGQTQTGLRHRPCAQLLEPELRCGCCAGWVDLQSVQGTGFSVPNKSV